MPATVKSLSLYTSYGVTDRNFVLVLILILVCLGIALFLGCLYLTERLFPRWKIYKRGWQLWKRFRRKYATVYTTEPSTRSLSSIPSFSRRTANSDFLDHDDDEDEDTTNPSKVIYSGHNDYQDHKKVEKFQTYGPMSRRVVLLQQFFVLTLMILNMLIYTHSAVQEDCHHYSNTTTNALFRNCRADRSPEETSGPRIDVYPILFMFTPVLLSCIFRETLFELQIINHFSVVLILMMTNLYVNYNLFTVIILCVWLFGGYCVLLDLHLHHVAAFLTSYQLREILLEKERNADQAAAAEMRHMIGNVAHDLKTPLSSFTTGLEIIADIIETNEKMIRTLSEDQNVATREKRNTAKSSLVIPFTAPDDNQLSSPPALLEHNQSIKQCLQNIRDTNTFMLMTINRCIDYTKASRGFKLVPKCETLDLLETLRLPLDCMKNIQERVHITLKPIDMTEICSHVITDKQWLQENILCLLSNAVKYSTGGEVTISVYLAKAKKNEAMKAKANNDKMKNPSLNNEPSFTTENTPPVKRESLTERWKKRLSFFDGIFTSFNQSTSTTTKCDNVEEDTSQTPRTAPAANSWKADDPMIRSPGSILKIKHQKSRLEDIEEGNETSLTKRLEGTDGNTHTTTITDTEEKQSVVKAEDVITTQCTEKNTSNCRDSQSITHVIRFDIEDTGIGMSADAMSQLFSPFRQAQRLAGGTGLGLYSLAKRVEALNGSYGVMKRPDGKQGSLFWFSIPYRPDKTTAELTSSLAGPSKDGGSWDISKQQTSSSSHYLPRGISLSPPCRRSSLDGGGSFDVMKLPKLKILLVDDSPSIVKMSSMMLKRQGHTVQVADNGEIALQCIQQQWTKHQRGFDVILMDLQMPVMDGLEATRRLRRLEKDSPSWLQPMPSATSDQINRDHVSPFSKFCPEYKMSHIHEAWSNLSPAFSYHHAVIGVSANSDDETAKEALQAGVDAFLPKPFSMELFNMTTIKILTKIYDSYYQEGTNE